ncbi:hypothetical protein K2X89_16910 [Myxococcota bacterium]|nr:hypothetical protein [Myxococcota bacterium]
MAKLTIEIDMNDPQEAWDALYRRIEEFGDESDDANPTSKEPGVIPTPVTYDLLLDPERAFGDLGDFFAVLTARD